MTTSLRPARCLSRRHFARISTSVMFGLSSMNSGASLIRPIVEAIVVKSCLCTVPLRMWWSGTLASAERSRIAISLRLISSEKMMLGSLCLIDAARAMSRRGSTCRSRGAPR